MARTYLRKRSGRLANKTTSSGRVRARVKMPASASNFNNIKNYIKLHKRLVIIGGGIGLIILIAVVQVTLYNNRLPVFASIDGNKLGNLTEYDARQHLGELYKNTKVKLKAEGSDEVLTEIAPYDFGVLLDTDRYVKTSVAPLWLLVLPGAPLWVHHVQKAEREYQVNDDELAKYLDNTFTKDCKIAPQNANLKVEGDEVAVEPSRIGGECEYSKLEVALKEVRPSVNEDNNIALPVKPIYPKITNQHAEELKNIINKNLADDVVVKAGEQSFSETASNVRKWLRFSAPDEGIVVSIDAAESEPFLNDKVAAAITKPAGVSKVTTKDFVELSRSNGAPGVGLDFEATRQAIINKLRGESEQIEAITQKIEPRVEYTRSYSNTDEGLSALLKQFTEDRKGSFGVALIELDDKRRNASFNGDKQFTSASTYKLFIAYSVLKRVEAGQMSWGDQVVGGRNLEKCFDDMIVLSDNPCPLTLVSKIGPNNLQKEVKELGLNNTNFLDKESFKMTANDLVKFAAMLESRQLPVSRASQDKLISAMKRNVHRQGIPAGSGGTVADKVGFIDRFLHDVGIVYGTKGGTYALAILTEGSSWADIAELTKKIEKLRSE